MSGECGCSIRQRANGAKIAIAAHNEQHPHLAAVSVHLMQRVQCKQSKTSDRKMGHIFRRVPNAHNRCRVTGDTRIQKWTWLALLIGSRYAQTLGGGRVYYPKSPEITRNHPKSPEITRNHPKSPENRTRRVPSQAEWEVTVYRALSTVAS